MTPTQAAPARSGDERRAEPPEVEPLEGVDVPDHAGEQVAAAVSLELGRGERLDPLVEARADAAERPQGEVVRDEPVEVAHDRPREPEEANGDDRHGQREDRRLLGGPRDEVARGRHQRDAEADGERAEAAPRAPRAGRARPRTRAVAGASASGGLHRGALDDPALDERHDSIGGARKLGPVGDQEDRSVVRELLDGLGDEVGVLGVEVRRSARRGSRAARRAGTRARARSAGAARPRAAARRRRRRCRTRREAPRRTRRRRRCAAASRTRSSVADASPRRMLSATVPRKIVGRCGTQAICFRQATGSQLGQIEAPDGHAAGRRLGEAEEEGGQRALARSRSARRARPSRPGRARGRRRRGRRPPAPGRRRRPPRAGWARHADRAASTSPRRRAAGASARSSRRSATASPSALAWNWAARFRSGR